MSPSKADPSDGEEGIKSLIDFVKGYYESESAQNFYHQVWGGKYTHVGLYEALDKEDAKLDDRERLSRACQVATDVLLRKCFPAASPPPETCTLIDLGAGYGGTAREAVRRYGCKVICVNIASRENAINAKINEAEGLADKITIPGELSYFDTGLPAEGADVVYSQDAILHAGSERHRVFRETARLLKPGGLFVLVDILLSENASSMDADLVRERLKAGFLDTQSSYRRMGKESGLEMIEYADRSESMAIHYPLVLKILMEQEETLTGIDDKFLEYCRNGLVAWSAMISRHATRWGHFVFKKTVTGTGGPTPVT